MANDNGANIALVQERRWVDWFRLALGLAMSVLIALVAFIGNNALSKLDRIDATVTATSPRIDAMDRRIESAETTLRDHEERIRNGAERITGMEGRFVRSGR